MQSYILLFYDRLGTTCRTVFVYPDLFNHCFSYSCLSTFVIYMLLQGWNQCSPCMSRSSRGPCLVLVICFNSLWSRHMKFSNKPVYEVLAKTKEKKCKFLFCEVLYSASSIDLYICAWISRYYKHRMVALKLQICKAADMVGATFPDDILGLFN